MKLKKLSILLITAVVILLGFSNNTKVVVLENENKEEWIADIEYFKTELEKNHKNPFSKISKEEFENEISILLKDLPYLQENEVIVRLMEITQKIGDSHTHIGMYTPSIDFHYFPLNFNYFSDGLYVISASKEYADLVGLKLEKINDYSIEEIDERIKKIIPHENTYYLKTIIPLYIRIPEILEALDLLENNKNTKFYFKNTKTGEVLSKNLSAEKDWSLIGNNWINFIKKFNIQPPLYLKNTDPYWYEYLPDTNILFVRYASCYEKKDQTFKDFTEELFEVAEDKPVKYMIVDLRYNSGGFRELFRDYFLPKIEASPLNQKGKLFFITNNYTFSSGVWAAVDLAKNTNATSLGEPTGNKPNHFGLSGKFSLPNSKIQISYSKEYWHLIDSDIDAFYPEIEIPTTSEDFLNGSDPIMNYILEEFIK
ncbi:hypothetical protein [Wukongibacter sp. M2B1]|uniref:hypothetical protein n=1 Tax=Wukongibacter sp. M2B1 TaxID=3088895 RepID=UPI003D790ED1